MNDLTPHISAGTQAPFDTGVAERTPQWRRRFAWPLPHPILRDALVAQFHAFWEAIVGTKDEFWRRSLLATSVGLQNELRTHSQAALWVDAETKSGIALAGAPVIFEFLRSGVGKQPEADISQAPAQTRTIRGRWLRHVARTASWTPLWKLPGVLLAPQIIAASQHNEMLIDTARVDPRRIKFRYSDLWLNQIVGEKRPAPAPPANLIASVVEKLTKALPLANASLIARLGDVLSRSVGNHLRRVAADLVCLEAAKDLPGVLWSGAGGYYPSRVIGLEVMRRGGFVKRFDHGGATGFFTAGDEIAFSELAVCSTYHVATDAIARIVDASEAARLARQVNKTAALEGGQGDSTFATPNLPRMTPGSRPHVMYTPTSLLGYRQLYPPSLPDPVYLDWQLRLAEALKRLSIELTCKPHPEDIYRDRQHPLELVAPTTRDRFGDVMARADVFVFDYPMTTALYEAMSTDRVLVYIDLGITPMNPAVEERLRRRCRVIGARYDARGLPVIDAGELAEAVTKNIAPVDPSEIRQLLLGR